MRNVDWSAVKETGDRPIPGAYIAKIVRVEDREDKEYLRIEWDFAEGNYKGNNQETYDRAGFWPVVLIRSYKPGALGFFKAFKTCVEESNPGYAFDTAHPEGLQGKRVGVVLGEEEYIGNDGKKKTRLYVAQTRSIDAIARGDFTVPEPKRLDPPTPVSGVSSCDPYQDDGPLPWET